MEKDDVSKLGETIKVRFSPKIESMLKIKACEQKVSLSEVVREACYSYLNMQSDNTELLFASINNLKEQIRFQENKIDLLSVILLEQTKLLLQIFPSNHHIDSRIVEDEYEKFMDNVSFALKENHGGKLESMFLDIYSNQTAQNVRGGN